jgi:hypothetical protein
MSLPELPPLLKRTQLLPVPEVTAVTPEDTPVVTTGTVEAVQPVTLPEAPCSVNCHITIAGRQCQLTLRDSDEGRLLARLQAVLA